jgi:hypothetical protein
VEWRDLGCRQAVRLVYLSPLATMPSFVLAQCILHFSSILGTDSTPLGRAAYCSAAAATDWYSMLTFNWHVELLRVVHGNNGSCGRNAGSTNYVGPRVRMHLWIDIRPRSWSPDGGGT